jgi:putative flavoprotein involved in K+ transport
VTDAEWEARPVTLGSANGHVSFADDAETILRAADEAYDVGGRLAVESPDVLVLAAAGVATVLWATRYVHDYDWLHIPVFDARGRPDQQRVGDDAEYLADRINEIAGNRGQ